jgi:phage terminase large subunit GpA-like protein
MPSNPIEQIGADWLEEQIGELTEEIIRIKPSEFAEEHRYLPGSVTSIPGPMRFTVNPFAREIVDRCDVDDPTREINWMKGVQMTATTVAECVFLYYICHIKTLPIGFYTADKDLANARMENNVIPMLNQSGFRDVIQSSDEGNKRKTGKTKNHIQWGSDGYMVPLGGNNANKQSSFSFCIIYKDELDRWPTVVGKDGDPDSLTDARAKGYEDQKKIFRTSTPGEYPSKIYKNYLRGDQRKYMVPCLECREPQELRWNGTDDGNAIEDSVRYICAHCGHAHREHDKERLFAEDNGAKWVPTATPITPHIKSYHLSALYSPIGMGSWYECVVQYLKAWDPVHNKPRDLGEYQVFYNNILGMPFRHYGSKVTLDQAEAHRRDQFHYGEIPNRMAEKYSGSKILFLTCQVDVHKQNLAVSVMGWTVEARSYLINYWRFEDDSEEGCESPDSPAWERLRLLLEEKVYVSEDGDKYSISLALIDSSYIPDTVSTFCSQFNSGVFPIMGRPSTMFTGKIKEFTEFKKQSGTPGFYIQVDLYKDRMAPVLRRAWSPEDGKQPRYHFNTPADATSKQLKELTVESRSPKTDEKGRVTHQWYRPPGAPNELWDLLIYGECAVDILAWDYCINQMEMDSVDWDIFWGQFSV